MKIVTIGFAEFIEMGLYGIVMIFNNVLFFGQTGAGSVVMLVAILGILYIIGQSIFAQKIEIAPAVLAMVTFVVLFSPNFSMDVTIEDRVTGELRFVDDVPLGPALAGGVTSQIATTITELFQTAYWSGDLHSEGAQLTMGYFAYPLRMMLTLRELSACSLGPVLCQNTLNYHRECIMPVQMSDTRPFPDDALDLQPDKVYFRGAYDPSAPANFDTTGYYMNWRSQNGGSAHKKCEDGAEALQAIWDGALDDEGSGEHERLVTFLESNLGGKLAAPGAEADNADDLDGERIRSALGSIVGNLGEERNFLVAQMVNNIQATAESGFSRDPAAATWMTQMMERQRIQNATEASGFMRMSMILMGLMQFLFIVLTPVVAVVALAKMGAGFKVLGGWLLLAVWSSSFLITITVIDSWARTAVRTRFTDHFDGSAAVDAMSLPGLEGTYNHVADILSTANGFLTATPIITLVLLTGSIYPLAAMATRMAGVADMQSTAGLSGVSDQGAATMSSQYAPAQNLPGKLGGDVADRAHQNWSIKGSEVVSSAHQSATDLQNQLTQRYTEAAREADSAVHRFVTSAQDTDTHTDQDGEKNQVANTIATEFLTSQGYKDILTDEEFAIVRDQLAANIKAEGGYQFRKGTPAQALSPVSAGKVASAGIGFSGGREASDGERHTVQDVVSHAYDSLVRSAEQNEFSLNTSEEFRSQLATSTSGDIGEAFERLESVDEAREEARSLVERTSDSVSSVNDQGAHFVFDSSNIETIRGNLLSNGDNLEMMIQRMTETQANQTEGFGAAMREHGVSFNPDADNEIHETQRFIQGVLDMSEDENVSHEHQLAASRLLANIIDKSAPGMAQGAEAPKDYSSEVAHRENDGAIAPPVPPSGSIDDPDTVGDDPSNNETVARTEGFVADTQEELNDKKEESEKRKQEINENTEEKRVEGLVTQLNHASSEGGRQTLGPANISQNTSPYFSIDASPSQWYGMYSAAMMGSESNQDMDRATGSRLERAGDPGLVRFGKLVTGWAPGVEWSEQPDDVVIGGMANQIDDHLGESDWTSRWMADNPRSEGQSAIDYANQMRDDYREDIGETTKWNPPTPDMEKEAEPEAMIASGLTLGHLDPDHRLLAESGSEIARNVEAGSAFIGWASGADDNPPARPEALESPEDVQAVIYNDYFDHEHYAATGGERIFSGQVSQIAMEVGNLTEEQLSEMNRDFQNAETRFDQQQVFEEHLGLKATTPGDANNNWHAMQQRVSGFYDAAEQFESSIDRGLMAKFGRLLGGKAN